MPLQLGRGSHGALPAPPLPHEDVPPPPHRDAPPWLREDAHLDRVEHLMSEMIAMGCSDMDKLGCVVSLLDGEAHHWWLIVEHGTALERVEWDFFLESFRRKFMGEQYLEARHEFMDLI
ncbi:hypothetical protein GOBAR_AA11089 [Gossypium barbadense]|uniref:Retrotransposon gag domain-containing protein n=1 Tax=Gossypium barbadense TaxID=3634 RepID=A0A2P5Y1U5_GOSBA|nr:hypothetical protein GOBAR_AA11089 [Gossypium barbadense]